MLPNPLGNSIARYLIVPHMYRKSLSHCAAGLGGWVKNGCGNGYKWAGNCPVLLVAYICQTIIATIVRPAIFWFRFPIAICPFKANWLFFPNVWHNWGIFTPVTDVTHRFELHPHNIYKNGGKLQQTCLGQWCSFWALSQWFSISNQPEFIWEMDVQQ